MANYLAIETKAPLPMRNADGTLKQFMLSFAGRPYRCPCKCNVFHKPDRENFDLYQCNACDQQFEAVAAR